MSNMIEMSPNVYGIETEYSGVITLPGSVVHEIVGQCHSVDTELGLYQQPTDKGTNHITNTALNGALYKQNIRRTGTGMLTNGGRMYDDPSGVEYDTAEVTTAEEAVHRTFDGDTILLRTFEHLREAGVVEGSQFNRKIVDHNRTSRGIHLNTVTNVAPEDVTGEQVAKAATLNVVKGAIFGSGGLLIDEKGETHFHHSPRLSLTTDISSHYSNYTHRPLVRTPYKNDGAELYRVETVSGDALNFGWPLRASLITTNAVNSMAELGLEHKLPELRDPIRAAHTVGRFGCENMVSVVENGRNVGRLPLDVMRDICETILNFDDSIGFLDDESHQVLNEVIEISDVASRDLYEAAGQIESAARLIAMQRKMRDTGAAIDSEKLCRFDYAWDWIGGGFAARFRESKQIGWHGFNRKYSPHETNRRIVNPPNDTRALVRAATISKTTGDNHSEWHMIQLGSDPNILTHVHPLNNDLTLVA